MEEGGSAAAVRAPDDPTHRSYDRRASTLDAGDTLRSAAALGGATRRKNTNLCVPRSRFIEPYGEGRELYYEQKLLQGMPWHCDKKPMGVSTVGNEKELKWTFTTTVPNRQVQIRDSLREFSMVGRTPEDGETFEQKCVNMERAFSRENECQCCALGGCRTCLYAEGWHQCEKDCVGESETHEAPYVWRAGTLHNGVLDIDSSLWTLARRFVPVDVLKIKLDTYIKEGHINADQKEN